MPRIGKYVLFITLFFVGCATIGRKTDSLGLERLYKENPGKVDKGTLVRKGIESTVYLSTANKSGEPLKFGTGVIIDQESRLILTAAHVVSGASYVRVTFLSMDDDGNVKELRTSVAKVISSSWQSDSAVLKVGGSRKLPPAMVICRNCAAYSGRKVVHLGKTSGTSFGEINRTLSRYRRLKGRSERCMRVDMRVDYGDSGAPLIDAKTGCLIGIIVAITHDRKFGLAIQINQIIRSH